MANQVLNQQVQDNLLFAPAIREAASFLLDRDNTKKTWGGLSYPQVLALVINFINATSDFQTEGISVEQLAEYVKEILRLQEQHLESVVPKNLQVVLEDLKKAEKKEEIFKQKAALEAQEYIRKEEQKAAKKALSEAIRKKVQIEVQKETIETMGNGVSITDADKTSWQKIATLPEESRLEQQKQFAEQRGRKIIEQALENASGKGANISSETYAYVLGIEFSSREWGEIFNSSNPQRAVSNLLDKQLRPLYDAQEYANKVASAVVDNLPSGMTLKNLTVKEIDDILQQATTYALAETQEGTEIPSGTVQQTYKAVRSQTQVAQNMAKNATAEPLSAEFIASVSGVLATEIQKSPEIQKVSGGSLSPKDFESVYQVAAKKAIVSLVGKDESFSLVFTPTAIQIIAASPSTLETMKAAVNGNSQLLVDSLQRTIILATTNTPATKLPSIDSASLRPKLGVIFANPSFSVDLSQIPGNKRVSVVEEIRKRFESDGLTSQNLRWAKEELAVGRAQILAVHGITPKDLENTAQAIRNEIAKNNDPLAASKLNRQLDIVERTREAMDKLNLSPEIQQELEKKAVKVGGQYRPDTRLPASEGAGVKLNLSSRLANVSSKSKIGFNKFLSKTRVGQSIGNAFSRFTGSISNKFYKTGLGQGVKTFFNRFASNSFKTLFKSASTVVKTGVSKGILSVATKLGLKGLVTAISGIGGPVGMALGLLASVVAGKIIKGGIGLIKKGVGFITSGFGLTSAIGSFFGQMGEPQKETFPWLMPIVLFTFIGIFALQAFFTTSLGGAFLGEGKGSGIPGGIEVPLQCLSTRHLSEETICKLSRYTTPPTPPCNNNYITTGTWSGTNGVEVCFNQISLQGKSAIQQNFHDSVFGNGNLQCGGFAMGIQAALSRPLNLVNSSKDWLTNFPSDTYRLATSGKPDLKVGDLVLWRGGVDGHVAIVIVDVINNPSDNPDILKKITAAEANGFNGRIGIVEYPYNGLGSGGGSPDGVLHYFR